MTTLSSMIQSFTIHIDSNKMECPITLFEDSEYTFGIVNITIIPDIPITTTPLHIVFTIDASGSMSDMCSDGRTKMHHILFTLENMLYAIYKKTDSNISVYIQSFSSDVSKIVTTGKMYEENMDVLIHKIHQIRPTAATNIEAALKSANSYIDTYKIDNVEHDIVHLFLTDGEITEGEPNKKILKKIIKDNCSTIFIGYGTSHDSDLLSFISSDLNNEYRFIDALEKAGFVYGEILHGLMYKAIEKTSLIGTNCEMYNYITNTWSESLYIGDLLSEQTKVFHIRTKTPNECIICLTEFGTGATIRRSLASESDSLASDSLASDSLASDSLASDSLASDSLVLHYKFRQRTQELLYETRQISIHKKVRIIKLDEVVVRVNPTTALQQKLKDFHLLLTTYMIKHDMETDIFLKNLADDIYIVNKTIDTRLGNMYSVARQTSQGRQQTYTCNYIAEETENIFYRQPPQQSSQIYDYTPSQEDISSPYSSNAVLKLMRDVSRY